LYQEKEDLNLMYPSWCITDVRFPNEVDAIKDRNGIVIRVNRPLQKCKCGGDLIRVDSNTVITCKKCQDAYREHESETALDYYGRFSYVIENDGSISDLIEKVREILIKERIL